MPRLRYLPALLAGLGLPALFVWAWATAGGTLGGWPLAVVIVVALALTGGLVEAARRSGRDSPTRRQPTTHPVREPAAAGKE